MSRDTTQAGGNARGGLMPWIADSGGWAALLGVLYACGVAVYLLPQAREPHPLWLLPAVLVAWHASRLAARHYGLPEARARAWRLCGWGLLATAISLAGSVALTWLGQPELALSVAGLRTFFYAMAATAAVAVMLSADARRRWGLIWHDSLVVLLCLGALLWWLVARPALGILVDLQAPGVAPATYALLDACLLLLAGVVLAAWQPGRASPAGLWIATGVVLMLAADMWAAGLSVVADDRAASLVLLLTAHVLLAVAAQADRVWTERSEPEPVSRTPAAGTAFLPLAGLVSAMAVLVYHQSGALTEPVGAMSAVVCAAATLALLRQRVVTRNVAGQEASRARRAAEDRFASLVRHSSDVIAIAGENARLIYVTPSAERVFGRRAEDLLGQGFVELFAAEDQGRLREFFINTLADPGASARLELRVPRGGDRFRATEIIGSNLADEPTVAGWVLNIRDITDRKTLEDQLKRLAFHDPLTLLANRALFRDRVDHAVAVARRRGSRIAAIFVDLDNFKKINDSLGHGEGDRVLRATAQRLTQCTRTGDTVARLGGDEFAVLIEDAAREDDVIETAARIVDELKQPFTLSGSSLSVAASVGVAFAAQEDGVEELLRNADVAMYHAKASGKSRYAVFQAKMQEAVRDRLRIEADLTRAIGRSELRLHYQPIVDLASGYLLGVEALVRWQHPERGLIPPAEFIGVAEETGQVVGLGRWVLYEACEQVKRWQLHMPRGDLLRVAVNVSGQQLQGGDLVAEVTGALEHSGLDPGCLVVEMTESVVMNDIEATFAKLKRLKRLGVRIAIDDFGTGYSSLSYLHRFPIDILKIDRSFVQRLGMERDGTELARAIITLGETLGLEVVAEGIEFEHQVRQLMQLGCVAGQGYYYSKPALLKEIEYSHHARLRRSYVRDLPAEAAVSATGRFRRLEPDDFEIDLGATGTGGS